MLNLWEAIRLEILYSMFIEGFDPIDEDDLIPNRQQFIECDFWK